jgi:hypothetical protein
VKQKSALRKQSELAMRAAIGQDADTLIEQYTYKPEPTNAEAAKAGTTEEEWVYVGGKLVKRPKQ